MKSHVRVSRGDAFVFVRLLDCAALRFSEVVSRRKARVQALMGCGVRLSVSERSTGHYWPASVVVLVFVMALSGCREGELERADSAPPLALVGTALEGLDSTDWVAFYDPGRASNGYMLALYDRQVPILVDMNGRIVHGWPNVRAKSRARLLADGSILTLDLTKTISQWSWSGERVAHWPLPGRIPHHDLIPSQRGHVIVVTRSKGERTDDILEVNFAGETVWEWSSGEHLAPFFDRAGRPSNTDQSFFNATQAADITHINSVQELPENRHFDAGDTRFRPGNLLISARNLDTIFVIDRETGEVAWEYTERLDFQHEALMVEPGLPRAGNILVFNNGYHYRYRYRSSEIVEIDPSGSERVWEYSSPTFFSSTGGVEQPLPNGNVMVSSGLGGRVFEVTPSGDIVWQWTPTFEPRRPHRVPYDFTPQLEALPRPRERRVKRPRGYEFVDRDAYLFARRGDLAVVNDEIKILRDRKLCKRLLLPQDPVLETTFGVDLARMADARIGEVEATFSGWIEDSGETHYFLDESVRVSRDSGASRREVVLDLAPYGLRSVNLCVEVVATTPEPEEDLGDCVFWQEPRVLPAGGALATPEADDLGELNQEELEARLEHLRALGYVD